MNTKSKTNNLLSLLKRTCIRGRHRFFKRTLIALIIFLVMPSALAANKTFTGPGNFSEAAKWDKGTLPGATDKLFINGVCTYDNAAANLVYGLLEIGKASAGTLVWPVGGTNTLRTSGIVASSFTGGGTLDMSNGGKLSIGNSNWITTRQTFIPGAGTIIWADVNSGSTLPTATGFSTFNNLTIASTNQTATLGAATTVNGHLTLQAGTLAASTFSLVVKGDWYDNGGTFTPNSATVIFKGSGAQKIGGFSATSFYNVAISNTSAVVSAVTNLNVSGTMTIGTGAIFSPLADKIINSAAAAGTLTGAGTLRVTRTAATADLRNQYKFATYKFVTLKVDYSGADDQTVNNTLGAYHELILSGIGIKKLQGAVTNSGVLTVRAGVTLAVADGNGSISGVTTLDAGGVLEPGFSAGTFTFQNNLTLQPSAEFHTTLGVSSNQVVLVAGTAVINGATLSVTGVDPLANTYTLLLAGTLSGTFAGLPDGTLITVSPGLFYRIHYRSNEVILIRSQGPTLFSFF